MEDHLSQLGWGFCSNEEGIEELKHTLLFTTLELETTLITAKEEIAKRQLELDHVKDVLSKTIKERDEARSKCRKLMLEQQNVGTSQKCYENKYETGSNSEVSSSDDESNSNAMDSMPRLSSSLPREALKLAANRSLPEKGRLLQAVKDAGPLLQNLLLAGPLPQWQHPPPQLATVEIPPVVICSPRQQLVKQDSFDDVNVCFSKKRGPEDCEGFESSPNTKYHKVALH